MKHVVGAILMVIAVLAAPRKAWRTWRGRR